MEDTSGFYKIDENGDWLYAPNFVETSEYSLYRELKDEYEYPIDGWQWYDEPPQEYVEWLNSQEA
jgi:hypothetical protein